MPAQRSLVRLLALAFALTAGVAASQAQEKKQEKQKKEGSTAAAAAQPAGRAVAWREVGDIAALDLTYGPGAAEQAPAAPFTFLSEDRLGTSPKVMVRDARGVVWCVKTGVEAQTETVATRLMWAMGYYAEESYYLQTAEIKNLPKLARGQEFVRGGNTLVGARFEPRRAEVGRGERWDWEQNPFVGRREFNGLKVMMVLFANYDARPENNQVFTVRDAQTGELQARYLVSDVGATLGKVGGLGGKRSKNSLEDYRSARLIEGVEGGVVKFDYHTKPKGAGGFFASVFNPGYKKSQAQKERVMQNIPVEDVRWIGQRLSQLTDEQLRTAFRAAGYDAATMEGFVSAFRQRINQLAQVSPASQSIAQTSGK
jgi:hypothetical protein